MISKEELEELAEEYDGIDPLADLEQLINELATAQGLHDTIQSPVQKLIYNESYVRDVLGITIPLNESYPYSAALQERILEEQLLLEGFFGGFKKLKEDGKHLALALRYMMEDGSRVKDFVKQAYESVIKEPLTKILDFIKQALDVVKGIFEKFIMPKIQKTWEKIQEFLEGVAEKLEASWESIKSMSGWKQALTVIAFGTGIGYLWKKIDLKKIVETAQGVLEELLETAEDWGEKLADIFKKADGPIDLKKTMTLAKKSRLGKFPEGYTLALSPLLLTGDDDAINELFGLGGKKKKKKDDDKSTGDKVSDAEQKADDIEAKLDKADKWMARLSGEEEGLISKAKEQIMALLQPLIDVIKGKVVDMFQGVIKKLGAEALVGLVSGGIGPFISGIKGAFGGIKMVSDLFGDALGAFVKKIKDPEAEAEEAEKGEDDPTEAVWHDNEKLLREFIREKLLAA
jgi:hypothetical protein